MTRRVLAVLAALVLLIGLTSCEDGSAACIESGGTWEQTGTVPVTTWITTGKSSVPITNFIPTHACIGVPR